MILCLLFLMEEKNFKINLEFLSLCCILYSVINFIDILHPLSYIENVRHGENWVSKYMYSVEDIQNVKKNLAIEIMGKIWV